jgi:hypothetical protein
VDEDIFDRYDFGEAGPLGAGGYGSVYLAKDRTHRGRIVAVKKAMMMDGDSVIKKCWCRVDTKKKETWLFGVIFIYNIYNH